MYFSLCNAPAFFQRMMWRDFTSFLEDYKDNTGQYMDNFWMATKDDKEGRALHVQMIHEFLDLCEKHSYFLKPSKCEIMVPSMLPPRWQPLRLRATLLQVEGFMRRMESYPSPTRRSRAHTRHR